MGRKRFICFALLPSPGPYFFALARSFIMGNYRENQLKEKAVHFTHRIEGKNDMKVPNLWGLAKGYTCAPLTFTWVYIS